MTAVISEHTWERLEKDPHRGINDEMPACGRLKDKSWDKPRRTMCRMMNNQCGACENCWRDAWSEVWRMLHPEDREWLLEQYAIIGLGEWEARPSPMRYVLR